MNVSNTRRQNSGKQGLGEGEIISTEFQSGMMTSTGGEQREVVAVAQQCE